MTKKTDAAALLLNRARRVIDAAHRRRDAVKHDHQAPISDIGSELWALEDAADRFEHGAPQPKRQPYEAKTEKTYGDQNELTEKHESFGMLGFNRVSGSVHLYGSHIEQHQHFISMRVYRSHVSHSLSNDHYYTDGRLPIVEVYLSAAQFAEAITTLNAGEGVPCTIQEVEGVAMEDVPAEMVAENVKIRDAFERDVKEVVDKVTKARDDLAALVEAGSSVSKARAREMVDVLHKVVRELGPDASFVVSQFQESAERVVSQAKAEVEAFTMHALTAAGMEHFKQLSARGDEPDAITDGPREPTDTTP